VSDCRCKVIARVVNAASLDRINLASYEADGISIRVCEVFVACHHQIHGPSVVPINGLESFGKNFFKNTAGSIS